MKYCKDCKFLNNTFDWWCNHHNNGRNIVTGRINAVTCRTARSQEDLCGRVGKWFEKKEKT